MRVRFYALKDGVRRDFSGLILVGLLACIALFGGSEKT